MRSLDAIFKPRSIAVIGATPRAGSIGREILNNLFANEFNGKIFPVNPKYEYIHSTKAYASVTSIPDPVDLAVSHGGEHRRQRPRGRARRPRLHPSGEPDHRRLPLGSAARR